MRCRGEGFPRLVQLHVGGNVSLDVIRLGNCNVGALRLQLRHRLVILGARQLVGHLLLARVQIHKGLAGFHDLIVGNMHGGDGSGNPRADNTKVSVHLGIVGRFPSTRIHRPPGCGAAYQQRRQACK